MTTVVKGKIFRQDIEHWDGVTKTANRRDQTGGTISGLVCGYEVDVLASYGNGENYTLQTIKDCVRRIGSASVTLIFNPGTWTIDDDLTIGSNFVCRVPAGAVFSVSSGKTLTFSGPVIHDAQTWTSGSGTVTENGTRYLTGKLDLTGSVLQGASPLVFEGGTDNGFETTLSITNPTADRTITFPDADVNLGSVPTTSGTNNFTGNNTFTDANFTIADDGDSTKKVQFQCSGITTATTRTLTVPNQSSTLVVQGDVATQAQQEAASSTATFVSPGRQHYHPGSPKIVAALTNLGNANPTVTTLYSSMGSLSCTRSAAGTYSFIWTDGFSTTSSMVVQVTCGSNSAFASFGTKTSTTVAITVATDTGGATDPTEIGVTIWGDMS